MATAADVQAAVDALEASVSKNTTVDGSAGLLIVQLNQLYKDALASGGTPDQIVQRIKDLTATVDANASDLATAVTDNTPAA